MKNSFAFRKLLFISVITFGLITFLGCSSNNNVKYAPSNEVGKSQDSQSTKKESYPNRYQEKYQDYYY